MLRFWRSLSRQLKPSILTAAGLSPNVARAHPISGDGDADADDGDDGNPVGIGSGEAE